MKKIVRILIFFVVAAFLAGITTSCAVFDDSTHAQNPKTFKHSKPLPKKYVIDNGKKPIIK